MVYVIAVSVILTIRITVLMITFVIQYHRTRNPVPAQPESNTLLEVVWTVIPTILALAMFYFG